MDMANMTLCVEGHLCVAILVVSLLFPYDKSQDTVLLGNVQLPSRY